MKPLASLLMFSMPSVGQNTFEYLDGELFLPVFSHVQATHTWLVSGREAGVRRYDRVRYYDEMKSFQRRRQRVCYDHDVELDGLDGCFDCASEVFVWGEYVRGERG